MASKCRGRALNCGAEGLGLGADSFRVRTTVILKDDGSQLEVDLHPPPPDSRGLTMSGDFFVCHTGWQRVCVLLVSSG